MSAITEFRDRRNLERAWRWIRSNADPNYKRYCGEQYSRFAIADDLIITDLRDRLRRGIYEPRHACKLMIPKRSGILRPYTLLTVEDQIVYQALVNVIAERLAPKIRKRYYVQTFGHMYAGLTSTWFYRKWADGYRAFNKAARCAFNHKLVHTASFDLTACYDSLDHSVLCHFLKKIGCEDEFRDFMRRCLGVWTATHERIYQNHGIPQGPLSSGFLSEAVLQHFDEHSRPTRRLVYLRYVDDIRLFASRDVELRRSLVKLDRLSKDVGLFPQASKIDIHQVTNISKELKSVSNPTETSIRGKSVNQDRLAKRIKELTPRLTPAVKITDETRFKYLLAHAVPSSRLNARMLTISQGRPDLTPSIARYFKRYKLLPTTVATELLSRVEKGSLYEYVNAEWIEVLETRLKSAESARLDRVLKTKWRPRSLSAEVKASAGRLLVRRGALTAPQVAYAIRSIQEGWVRCELVSALNTKITEQ
ncbi:MAG TPA: RNA-directed DNA polymerase [Terriglobales bacterium]